MSFVAKNLLTVSPSSFAPDDLPNLSHWFSSDYGLVKSFGPEVPATLQGDPIETWKNKANGPNATQLTTAQKPSLTFLTKSGTTYPAVLFGGSQVLEIGNSVTQNPPLTYYFVTVNTGGGFSKLFVCQSTSTLAIRNSFQTSTGGNLALRQSTIQNSSITTGGSSVLFAILNGGGIGRVGNRIVGTTSRQTFTGLGMTLANSLSTLIGASTTGGSNGIFGDFVEILIYKSAHTTTEQDQIIEYFKKRYPYIT